MGCRGTDKGPREAQRRKPLPWCFAAGVSEGFIQEVIFDWALKIIAVSKVARKGKGMAQKGSRVREAHKHRMCIVQQC